MDRESKKVMLLGYEYEGEEERDWTEEINGYKKAVLKWIEHRKNDD